MAAAAAVDLARKIVRLSACRATAAVKMKRPDFSQITTCMLRTSGGGGGGGGQNIRGCPSVRPVVIPLPTAEAMVGRVIMLLWMCFVLGGPAMRTDRFLP